MQDIVCTVVENMAIAKDTYHMSLMGSFTESLRPGQFINVSIDGQYLRRPISIFNVRHNVIEIIYKVVGVGTDILSKKNQGDALDTLIGLGNGYDLSKSDDHPLLIGGGVGVPPLYFLAKELLKEHKTVSVVLGFNSKDDVFYAERFKDLGCADVTVTTVDGSVGIKGFVTDALPENYTYVYTCGPEPMLKAVYKAMKTSGQFSFEERMGCGFGACMGCSCKTITGYKRICKEGPVLTKEEILWDD